MSLLYSVEESCIVEVICELSLNDYLYEMLTDPAMSNISVSQIWRLLTVY